MNSPGHIVAEDHICLPMILILVRAVDSEHEHDSRRTGRYNVRMAKRLLPIRVKRSEETGIRLPSRGNGLRNENGRG